MKELRILAVLAAFSLAACGTNRTDISDESPPPPNTQTADNGDIEPPPGAEPGIDEAPVDAPPRTEIKTSSGPLGAKDIQAALANKTFDYNASGKTGTVSYFSDGTFTYRETGKGEGTGVWQASEGKLCEALDPSAVQPKATRSECRPFTAANGSYQTGSKKLTPV